MVTEYKLSYTASEIDEKLKMIPNPVQKTDDMTEPVGVDESGGLWTVPGGGSGGINPPETAAVGQTIVVKAVDENGKPTEWEAADLGDKVVTIFSFTTEEDVERLSIPLDHSFDDVLSRCKVLEFQARINKSSTGQNTNTANLNACLEVWGPDAVYSASSSVFFLERSPCIPSVNGAQYCDAVAIVPMNSYRKPMFGERGICMQWGLYEAETDLFWPFIPQPGNMYVSVYITDSAGVPTFIGAGSTFEIRAWGSLT